jgi:hypothetical protein
MTRAAAGPPSTRSIFNRVTNTLNAIWSFWHPTDLDNWKDKENPENEPPGILDWPAGFGTTAASPWVMGTLEPQKLQRALSKFVILG